ncbi:hypothetical protein Vadar_029748 [Vaccinium darrowii]|uniref:Uncharacterized protein n=1 Tax=Vaccinium darrowii TaxID=229202 RepID=A0ACB7XUY9_9ERIC|nr:hypothetical protein Vadar_029748 [Vaccinium darrowii]
MEDPPISSSLIKRISSLLKKRFKPILSSSQTSLSAYFCSQSPSSKRKPKESPRKCSAEYILEQGLPDLSQSPSSKHKPKESSRKYATDYCRATDHTIAKLELPCDCQGRFLGSLNGVLLLALDIGDQLCIWNPSIRRYHIFSQPEYRGGDIYGLGYDSISDDFKVVRVTSLMNNQDHGYDSFTNAVHVFSSKLSLWKSIGEFGYTIRSPVTIINGAPHWVVGHRTGDFYFEYFKLLGSTKDEEIRYKQGLITFGLTARCRFAAGGSEVSDLVVVASLIVSLASSWFLAPPSGLRSNSPGNLVEKVREVQW